MEDERVNSLANIKFVYDKYNLIDNERIEEIIEKRIPFKIKCFVTKDGKVVITNEEILEKMKQRFKKLNFDKFAFSDYMSLNLFTTDDFIFVSELFKVLKDSSLCMIELLNTGKRMTGASQLGNFISTCGVNALVSSEVDKNIKYFAKKHPNIRRGIKFATLDTDERVKGKIKKKVNKVLFSKACNPDFIEFDINTLPNDILDNKRAEGMTIISSVINTDAKLNKAKVYTDSFVLDRKYMEEQE